MGAIKLIVTLLWAANAALLVVSQRACTQNDLEYRYTECDSHGLRWRVHVPRYGQVCTIGSPEAPVKGPKCDFTCEPGEYLDVEGEQNCKKCSAGTYSVGSGVRYDTWDKLPNEFNTDNDDEIRLGSNCTSNSGGWVPNVQELLAIPNGCLSTLSFPVELVDEGKITVEYKNTYDLESFFIEVRDSCTGRTSHIDVDNLNVMIFKKTEDDETDSLELKMKAGKYKVGIHMLGLLRVDPTPGHKFAINSIEIQGMAFTPKCTACKPGYYSSDGASACTACAENKYASSSGSSTCSDCKPTEYAEAGSSECKPSPPCTISDYYEALAPCKNNKTHTTYSWIQPKFCNEKLDNSIKLPSDGKNRPCPACYPGQSLNTNSGKCEYCPTGTYSNGSDKCKVCPIRTESRKSLTFTQFHTMPEQMTTKCISPSHQKRGLLCGKQRTWVPENGYLTVSDSIGENEFAILIVNITGFSNETLDGKNYGTLIMKFDLLCGPGDSCLFYVLQSAKTSEVHTIASWNKTSKDVVYKHNFTQPDIEYINLAFRKYKGGETKSSNSIKLSSLELINTEIGGASSCTECVLGGSETGCHRCKQGEYIATNKKTGENTCKSCPPNHILVDAFTCRPCPQGLIASADFTECLSDCNYTSSDGKVFDFTPISGYQFYQASSAFDIDGTPYFAGVNFTLCSPSAGSLTFSKPLCISQSSNSVLASLGQKESGKNVNSLVCKSTILPSDQLVSFQPLSVGDKLVNISTDNVYERGMLKRNGFTLEDNALTVHFHYVTEKATNRCPNGLNTTITLVCDLHEKGNGTKSFPQRCVGGTCDGCHYSLIWSSRHACPVCSANNYKKIIGQCVNGHQSIDYIPDKYCTLTDEYKSKQSSRPCSVITRPIKIGIAAASAVGLLLFACVIYCWKRSRKIEYKYMKLVEGAQGKEGELPAAETCAWSDDDEEADDKVAFKAKGDHLFGKKIGNKGMSDGFEKMKLVGSSLPEI